MSKLYSQLLRIGGIRLVGLIVGFVANFYAARLLIDSFGASGFGAVATIMSLPALLPFADLGFGNAVVNSYAAAEPQRREVLRIAVLVTSLTALGLAALSTIFYATGFLNMLLGPVVVGAVGNADFIAYVILLLTWLAMPLGLSYRLVQGQGRLHVAMAWQLLVPPIAILALLTLLGPLGGRWLAPSYLAIATVLVSGLFFGTSVVPRLRSSLNFKESWGQHFSLVLRSGLPSLVISLMLALSFQTGRIVLSHFSSNDQVVDYSLGLLLYAPASALFSVSAQHLWSHYARERAQQTMTRKLLRNNIGLYALLSIIGMLGLALLGDWIISAFVHQGSDLRPLFFAFGLMLIAQSIHLPSAMLLTSPSGLRWQAILLTVCTVLTVALSIVLAPPLGAVGVVLAGTLPMLFVQFPLTARKALKVAAQGNKLPPNAGQGHRIRSRRREETELG